MLNVTEIKPGDKEHYMKCANEYLNILAKESFLSSQTNPKEASQHIG